MTSEIIPPSKSLRPDVEKLGKEYIFTTFQNRLKLREKEAGILLAKDLITPELRKQQYDRLEAMVGNTPLLAIKLPNGSTTLVKAESQNPTESHYDRVYVKTLKELESRGIIKPGDDLFEISSGSAGISFAWVCNRLGYNASVFVPEATPMGRNQEIINFGAKLIPVGNNVPETSEKERREFIRIAKSKGLDPKKLTTDDDMFHLWVAEGKENISGMCMVNHSENHFTPKQLECIGDEIVSVLPKDKKIDYFVSILGNGANTIGITEGLKKNGINPQVIGVEDVTNPIQFETKYPGKFETEFGHKPTYETQQLIGASQNKRVGFLDVNNLDDIQLVQKSDWEKRMRQYNAGQLVVNSIGRTSAASLSVAERLDKIHHDSVILTVFYDKADRYQTVMESSGKDGFVEQFNVQPLNWKQKRAFSINDLPANLDEAYNN